VMKIICIYLPL